MPELRLRDWVKVVDDTERSPVIIHAPHGGTSIPEESRDEFVITDGELDAEILALTDHAVDAFARAALRQAGGSAVINRLSRFVVDVERFPGPEEEKNAVGMGVLYTHGSQRQLARSIPAEAVASYMRFFDEYSSVLANLVNLAIARHGRAIIVDVHSYHRAVLPHELHASEPRPELCVGYEEFHIDAELRDAVATCFADFEQGDNQTFHGSYVPLEHYQRDKRVQSVMLEIRRDRYMDEVTGKRDARRVRAIGASLASLVERYSNVTTCEGSVPSSSTEGAGNG